MTHPDMGKQIKNKNSAKTSSAGRQKIVIAGYFGFGNTGDEAILSVTLRDLKGLFPSLDFVVVSGRPEETTKSHSVRAVSHIDISSIVSEITTCNLIILGGGGLFHDYWGVDPNVLLTRSHSGIAYYILFPLLATLLEKPLLLNAIGVGPLFSDLSRQYTRMAFEHATIATVRDVESRDLLVSIGLDPKLVQVTADPAFLLVPSPAERAQTILEAQGVSPQTQPLIGVVLREWDVDVHKDSWTSEVAKALDQLIDRFDAKVVFLPFQELEGDLTRDYDVAMTVRHQMRHQRQAFVIEGECTPSDSAALLGQCQIVLGMRLHSIIFAAICRVPMIALVYDPKVVNAMRQLGREEFALELGSLDAGGLFEAMERTLLERVAIVARLESAFSELSALAEENNHLVAEMLRTRHQPRRNLSAEALRFLNHNLTNLILRHDEREKVVSVLEAEIARHQAQAQLQIQEMEAKDRIISARDEGIEWVRRELAVAQEECRKLAHSNESPRTHLPEIPGNEAIQVQPNEQHAEMNRLTAHLAENEAALQDLARDIGLERKRVEELAAHLEEEQIFNRGIVPQLIGLCEALLEKNEEKSGVLRQMERRSEDQESAIRTLSETVEGMLLREEGWSRANDQIIIERLTEIERAHREKSEQLEAHQQIVRSRDEGIAWLKGEVGNYQRISQGLASANRILNEELAEKDAHLQVLREAVQSVELELMGLKISRGWRLLDKFRKVRRAVRSMIGRPDLESNARTRPAFLVDRREVEWHSNLAPLLEDVRARLAGLSSARTTSTVDAPLEAAKAARPGIRLLPTPHESELRMILDEEPGQQRPGRPDVVCFSVIDWEFRFQRPQQMMSQFAAHGHRVFYISTTRFTPSGSGPRVCVRTIKENVFEIELCSVHQPDVYGEVIGGVNEADLAASLEEIRERFSIDEAISYVMIASWTQLALMTQERWGWRVIYDCMDEWDRFPGIKPAIVAAEKRLVERCDLLVVSSKCLSEKWSAQREKLRLARNGVDYDFYLSRFGPNHLLSETKRPIVGYFGAIADWFDLELLGFLAENRPDYTFVLLGGIFDVDVSNLLNRPNVRFLGQHPYELMPKYLYQFDVCMIPFKINPITEATDPVKLYEYLSSGKPVVSVNLPELEAYREHVYLAADRDEFVELLDRAVNERDRDLSEGRRALARSNDWRNRYETIVNGLSERTRRVSVVIVTYNNLELTRLCLESVILNTTHPNYEVIVVDNHSGDGTRAYLQFMVDRFPHLRIILNEANEGFARANNQGIEVSTGDDIILLNNDTVVPRGWLTRLVRHLRHQEVGLIGPVSNFVGNEARIEVRYQTWEEMESFAKQHTVNHDGEAADINMLAMFCVAMRREVYDEIGPLDEQFGVGMFEDDDYAHRVRLKGYRVMCAADVFVHHFGQASFKKLIETGEYDALFSRNLVAFESKWNVKWSPRSNVALAFNADYATATSASGSIRTGVSIEAS